MAILNPYNYSKPKNQVVKPVLESVQASNPKPNKNVNDKMDQYLETRILSAKPEELTYMLYEGLVKFIKKAILSLENKNLEKVNENAIKAQAIVTEFRSTLNMEVALSESLDSLYDYMERQLLEANLKKDVAIFEEMLSMAEDFRDTWKMAFNIKA